MSTTELRNEQWSKILEFLRSCPDLYVGEEDDCRRYVEAILWMARSGAPWRLLPEHYGHWNSVYKRFARWLKRVYGNECISILCKTPIWSISEIKLLIALWFALSLCCWSLQKNGGQSAQALGRSRGGSSTKIHVSVDGLGNPLRFELTAGQRHDITQAQALIADFETEHVIADKGYDSMDFLQCILGRGALPVIPPRSNRKTPREYDCTFTESATLWSVSSTRSSTTGISSLALTSCHRVSWDS